MNSCRDFPPLSADSIKIEMGEWLTLPQAEGILSARLTRGYWIQRPYRRGGIKRAAGFLSERGVGARDDVANMADIEGVDFDIVNKDLIDYYSDCFQ